MWKRRKGLLLALPTMTVLYTCAPVVAQMQDPLPPREPQADSHYVNESPSSSGFAVDLQSNVARDNNVFSNDANRQSDFVFQNGAFLEFWKTEPIWNVGIDYRPSILLHETATALNAVDQAFQLDGAYRLRRNLQVQLTESLYYTTGALESTSNEYFSLPNTSSTGLNSTLIIPRIRELTNSSALKVVYDSSRRTSFQVSGSYSFLDFAGGPSVTAGLFNTQSRMGGFAYQYRLTQHLTIGFRYSLQNYRYEFGARDDTHSAFVTALWEMGPHVIVTIFGGPSFSITGGPQATGSVNASASKTTLPRAAAGSWSPGAGGTLTLRSDQTVLRFTAQRLITDGGGLLNTVVNANEGAELRHRLVYGSDLVVMATNTRSVALQGFGGRGIVDTQSAGIALEHSLFENLSMHFGYDFFRQRVNQYVHFADVDEGRYTVGILYRIGNGSR
jgi:hypothetical protein